MKALFSTSILNSNPQSYFSSSVAVGNVARGYGAVARPRARDYQQTCESHSLHSCVRALTQHVEYLPFGEPLLEQRATSAGWQTDRLFNSKEYDAETGFYYYGARYYDPRLAIWLSPDPLQEKYPEVSSYCYVANNPINAFDAFGSEPIFDKKGNYLGSSKEGYTGDIYIYWGSDKVDFSSKSIEELILACKNQLDTYDYVKNTSDDLTNDAHSKIWTHIASHFEGLQVYDEKFSMSTIKDSEIKYNEGDGVMNWRTTFYKSPLLHSISGTKDFSTLYESTVENIASSIIVHEWYSHCRKLVDNKLKSHRLAYKNVINFKPLWNGTTFKYKKFVLEQLGRYTKNETARTIVDEPYRNLYKKYVE